MRRVAGLLFAAILLLSLPTLAPAGGLLGIGTPGFSSIFGGTYGSGSCDPGVPMCCPQFYVGYNIQQSKDRSPTVFDATSKQFAVNLPGFDQFTMDIQEPSGVWLGVSNYCRVGPRLGFFASGWYLFPTTGDASDNFTTFAPGSFVWAASKSMGWIDGAVILGSQCGLNLIAGFRWDKYNLRLNDLQIVSVDDLLPGITFPVEADLTMNHYMPFLGTQVLLW